MPNCLDTIVSLGLCDDEVSTSGFTLMQAGGMSPLNGDKIATEQYKNGKQMFEVKKAVALNLVYNDFIGVLQANNIASTITERLYDTCYFSQAVENGLYAGYRGILVSGVKTGRRAGLKKLKIKYIQVYPLQSAGGQILIRDYNNGVEVDTVFDVTFVANKLNTFTVDYTVMNSKCLVLIDNTELNFASTVVTCKEGCGGSKHNECATAHGFNGIESVRANGYGINVQFTCECDYVSLMCNFSKAFIGELIWLKWQELVYDEMYKTNRFNAWTTYNRDDIAKQYIPQLQSQYAQKYNSMVSGGLFEMLKQYQDECLNCRGIKQVTNI